MSSRELKVAWRPSLCSAGSPGATRSRITHSSHSRLWNPSPILNSELHITHHKSQNGGFLMANPVREMKVGQLAVAVYQDNMTLGNAAAVQAADALRAAIATRGHANAILATGNSQLTML